MYHHLRTLAKTTEGSMYHLQLSDQQVRVVDAVKSNPHFQETYWTHHIVIYGAHALSYHLEQDRSC